MNTTQPIKLKTALRIMQEKDRFDQYLPFQIAFYTSTMKFSQFKRIELPKAKRCGLPRQHQSSNDLIGVQPLLRHKHNYSVNIRLITELNHTPVIP